MGKPQGSWPTTIRETPGADVAITAVEPDGLSEAVVITNRGQIDQPLTDWALASLHGLEVYPFPAGTVLPASRSIRVLSGEGAVPRPPQDLVWTRQTVWANRSDTVLLFDNSGREVHRYTYPRPTIRESRVPKRKMLICDRDGYHLADWDDQISPQDIRERGLGPPAGSGGKV